MHNTLKSKLPQARGVGDLVVVIFLDVRGFSNFAGTTESANAALFLRSMYTQILNNFFPETTFFKPTGDGLMIIRRYDDDDLVAIVNDSLRQSIALVEAFPTICAGDKMINFKVPKDLGIGIGRGAATRLSSDDLTLDYSGRPLNLAARLMDLARPSGVVFDDEGLGLGLIEPEILQQFTEDRVYVRGISELDPLPVHYLTSRTVIEPSSHNPINKYKRVQTPVGSVQLKVLKDRGRFFHPLPEVPDRPDSCQIFFNYPKVKRNGTWDAPITVIKSARLKLEHLGGRSGVYFEYPPFYEEMVKAGVKSTWPVTMYIEYEMNDLGATVAEDEPPF